MSVASLILLPEHSGGISFRTIYHSTYCTRNIFVLRFSYRARQLKKHYPLMRTTLLLLPERKITPADAWFCSCWFNYLEPEQHQTCGS